MNKKNLFLLVLMMISCTLMAQKATIVKDNSKVETKNTKGKKVKIEIWSDVVCPFCFLGKKKMEQAIDKLAAKDQVVIIWRSYQLDPDFPKKTSIPTDKYLLETKGYSSEDIKGMGDFLTEKGTEYGINFNFDNALSFNTFDVHRLIQWAKSYDDRSNDLKEAFMVAHFTEGKDLSKQENLLMVIEKIGMDITQAKKILKTDAYSKEVKQDVLRANLLAINSVPYFLINDKEIISGAQDDSTFEEVLSKALKK